MDQLHLSDVLGATIIGATSTALGLNIPRGVIQSIAGYAPSDMFGWVRVGGTDLTYDAGGQLNGGTVTKINYQILGDTPPGQAMLDIANFSLPAGQLYNWFLTDATQTALAAILSGNDYIEDNLSTGDNLLRGYAGNDNIIGQHGADTIYGGAGDDHIWGGLAAGGGGGDTRDNLLRGEDGADEIHGGSYFDDIDGGSGNDTLTGSGGGDLFWASAGADRITDFNPAQGDQIRIGPGVTYLLGQNGSDTLVSLSNGSTITLLNVASSSLTGASISSTATGSGPQRPGGPDPNGPRYYSFSSITADQALNLRSNDQLTMNISTATSTTVLYGAGTITIIADGKTVAFGSAITKLTANSGFSLADGTRLYVGSDFNDLFSGSYGNDAEFGGPGDDRLEGSTGNNLLQGNQGSDFLSAGGGNDTMYGGQDSDKLILDQGSNFGQGNRGNDSISAGDGIDTLLGGQDNDTIVGGGGNDFLNGNLGNDFIQAGGGNDTLYGEGGADTLEGNEGGDQFRIVGGTGLDRITDFHRLEGDRIVLDRGATYTTSQVGADVVINIAGGDQVVLVGTSLSTLAGDWISLA